MIYTRNTSPQFQIKSKLCSPVISQQSPVASAGFTLLELLVVITLLAILATGALISYGDIQDEARDDVTRYDLSQLRTALLQFRRHTGEFPCRVYRNGYYVPDDSVMTLDFTNLPSTPDNGDLLNWCGNTINGQVDSAVSMLSQFPYDETNTTYTPLLWNPDTKRGWNGPYINRQGLIDAWGNSYVLLNAELDYSPASRCEKDGSGDYDVTGGTYTCLTADDAGWNATDYTLEADIARIVSYGANGIYDSSSASAPCIAEADDFVLCLVK